MCFVASCSSEPSDEPGTTSSGSDTSTGDEPESDASSVDASSSSSSSSGLADSDTGTTSSESASESTGVPDATGQPCDGFAQDCPDGYKCNPTATGPACFPISEDAVEPGQPCRADPGGADDCVLGAYCGFATDETESVCIPVCSGTSDDPICPDDSVCLAYGTGAFGVCTMRCDPLEPDCPGLAVCQAFSFDFYCLSPQENPLPPGSSCEPFECAEGSTCALGDVLEACADDYCCAELCDPDDPSSCSDSPTGLSCTEFITGVGFCGA